MDDADRAELRAAKADVTAIGTIAIRGVVAICEALLANDAITVAQVGIIGEFMLAGAGKSGATEQLQAQLHKAIGAQLSALVARHAGARSGERRPPARET